MKILHAVSSLDPAGGGPMEVVLQSSLACIRNGHDVDVVTLDDPTSPFLSGYPLRVHALGPARGGYRYAPRYVPWLRAHASRYDAVIVHGLWQYHGLGAWRALRNGDVPYFVFPHGMLDPWFRRAFPLKHLKKWLYWPWAEYRVLRDASAVLFTCQEERRLAGQSFALYRVNGTVVAFGTRAPPGDAERLRNVFLDAHPRLRGKRLALFLGRIHPKKGCDLLIDAFARVASVDPAWHLVVAGPDQSGLREALQARTRALGIADRVSWPGMLQDDLKWGAFHAAETFVLPSHQENFGIAVAEALACRLPVLISEKVNIWREIVDADAGFVDVDTADGCERTMLRWLALPHEQRETMRDNARRLFDERFTAEAMAESIVQALVDATGLAGPARGAAGPLPSRAVLGGARASR